MDCDTTTDLPAQAEHALAQAGVSHSPYGPWWDVLTPTGWCVLTSQEVIDMWGTP